MSDQNDLSQITVSEFLQRLDAAWASLQSFLSSLTPGQLSGPTDTAGWTVKDHLVHIIVWEDGINSLLEGGDRRARMGVDEATWAGRDSDAINAAIQQRNRERTPDDVLAALGRTHAAFRNHISGMSDADLQRPYNTLVPTSDDTRPFIGWLEGDSFGHYTEHLPWMQAIVDQS
ncbi:MAG: maleylpyruvate isomerase N-terminal domain-containing protein [Anaerolineae bacterium]|nr:maleylpyruvate isomerase N-terminal domain-containing protein [Anaerolineae bacterium]